MFDFDYCKPLMDSASAWTRSWLAWPSVMARDAVVAMMASSTIPAAVSLQVTPHPKHLEIDLIAVGGAGKHAGLGSWTLRHLCLLADFYGVDLALEVSAVPWPGAKAMSDDELESWYGRYGFVREDDGEIRRMVRRHGASRSGGEEPPARR